MRYALTICRAADALIHLLKLVRGDLSALVSLALSLLELAENARNWLAAKAEQAGEKTPEFTALKAA